ncbi:MAG: hypothetical protein PUD74_08790 [Bacteroidales bacterium]|nr:hypothetical protein [Bacteroidales bacterium]
MNFTKIDDICLRKDILHLSPGGDPTLATKRTLFIGSWTDTLHRPPNGAPAWTPGGDPSYVIGKTPCIGPQKETLHRFPKGDPAEGTRRTLC